MMKGVDLNEGRTWSLQELCVLMNASESSDLSGVLGDWQPNWAREDLPRIVDELGRAVGALVAEGLVVAELPGDPYNKLELTLDEVAEIVKSPKAWWNGDEGPEPMLWLALTDAGRHHIRSLPGDELRSYEKRG